LTLSLFLPLGLGSSPGPCWLGPCCHFGSLQGELPSFASFAPALPPPLTSNWTCLSEAFLPPLSSEQQLLGSSKPGTLLSGPGCPPGVQHFPGLPLLTGLGQDAGGERLQLLSLRPEGLEVKPDSMVGTKGCLDSREGFSSESHGLRPGKENPTNPNLENLRAVWPLDPP
jgi:hypothetical protein